MTRLCSLVVIAACLSMQPVAVDAGRAAEPFAGCCGISRKELPGVSQRRRSEWEP